MKIFNFDWHKISALEKKWGDSFYVLDLDKLRTNYFELSNSFKKLYTNTVIGYSYKTNYTPKICKTLHDCGALAEVVSEMEYDLARRLEVPASNIIYNGPYKSFHSIEEALISGTLVNIDSERDLKQIIYIANKHNSLTLRIGIRINFQVDDKNTSRFGISSDLVELLDVVNQLKSHKNIQIEGLHCHFPNRELNSFNTRVKKLLKISDSIFDTETPNYLSVGGGFFGKIPKEMEHSFSVQPSTFGQYAQVVAKAFNDRYKNELKKPTLVLEPGTALVANTMHFATKIIDIKKIRDKHFVTLAGSIFNISPISRNINLPFDTINKKQGEILEKTSADLVGYTCIEGDILSKNVDLKCEVGDFVIYHNIGSYSVVMKPPFILPNVPIISLERNKGTENWKLVKKAEDTDYIFQQFIF